MIEWVSNVATFRSICDNLYRTHGMETKITEIRDIYTRFPAAISPPIISPLFPFMLPNHCTAMTGPRHQVTLACYPWPIGPPHTLLYVCRGKKAGHSKVTIYRDMMLPKFPPLFYRWFLNHFPQPNQWFQARTAYCKTTSVWSMVLTPLMSLCPSPLSLCLCPRPCPGHLLYS